MRDAKSQFKVVSTLTPILGNTTAEGTGVGVDVTGHESCLMIAHCGISGDSLSGSLKWTVQFQECATDTPGSFTDIAQADLGGGTPTVTIDDPAEDDVIIARSYVGSLPWVRVLFTQTGTHTNGTPISASVILGCPHHGPTADTV
jgi:hypothetical protein